MTLTGVERLEVVQLSHWKVAEMIGEARREFSVSLLREREREGGEYISGGRWHKLN